jgi:hypothetical protein
LFIFKKYFVFLIILLKKKNKKPKLFNIISLNLRV